MRKGTLGARLLGVEKACVEDVDFDEGAEALVLSVRPPRRDQKRCCLCGRRCPGYDQGEGRRRWRALDLGTVQAFTAADAPRVLCPKHGRVVAAVPWARRDSGFPRVFEDQAAWLATHTSQSKLSQLLRVAWRTVGRSVAGPLYRAYWLKEQLREVFESRGTDGIALLAKWLSWAARSRLPAFVKVARTIRQQLTGIEACLRQGLTNARIEAKNNQLWLLTRQASGFNSHEGLIGLVMLKLGGSCPDLPGRSTHRYAS